MAQVRIPSLRELFDTTIGTTTLYSNCTMKG
jgi:hypothetical protein